MIFLRQLLATGFATKSLSALIIKTGAAGLSFVMFLTLARAMSQEDFGLFGFAFSLATILAVAGSLGQRNLVLRFASIYLAAKNEAAAYGVIRHGYVRVLAGSGALAACLILGAWLIPAMVPHRRLFIATGLLTIALALAEFQPNPQRAAGRVWLALLPRDIVFRAVMILFALWATNGLKGAVAAHQVVLVMAATLALLTLCQAQALRYTQPSRLHTVRTDTADTLRWRSTMWGMWGNSVVNAAGRNLAIVLMGALLPAAAMGAVFAALRISMVLELFLVAVNVVAAPLLAAKLQAGALDQVQRLCTLIAVMLGLPTLACFVLFLIWGDRVLELFGAGFSAAHPELVIISFGYLVSALCGPTSQIMEMAGHERRYFTMLTVTTVASLGTLPLAVMHLGTMGAAWCISLNLTALNLWAYTFIVLRIGVSPGILRVTRTPGTRQSTKP